MATDNSSTTGTGYLDSEADTTALNDTNGSTASFAWAASAPTIDRTRLAWAEQQAGDN